MAPITDDKSTSISGLHELPLSSLQREQIAKQIWYHLEALPHEDIVLSDGINLLCSIHQGVTRPMSSKGLAQWLWSRSDLLHQRRVLDMGTGCGIQGIVSALAGASRVLLTDISKSAVGCAQDNVLRTCLGQRCDVLESDLFDSIAHTDEFDVIIFAQPFFVGPPLADYEFTRGMLDSGKLIREFFSSAGRFLNKKGQLILMRWPFAGKGNDPLEIAPLYDYELTDRYSFSTEMAVQCGDFEVVVFQKK